MKKFIFVMPLMAVSLLASCGQPKQATQHFVTFESNGGSHIDTQRVDDGGAATDPGKSTRPGYHFEGWYTTNPNPTPIEDDKYNFDTKVTGDITLYAGWTASEVTYHSFTLDGDGCGIFNDPEYSQTDIEEGSNLKFSIVPDSEHIMPLTVNITEGSGCASYENGVITITNMNSDVVVTASAAPVEHITYTITFHDGGDTEPKIENIEPGSIIPATDVPEVPTKEGHTPIGWCTDQAGTKVFDFVNVEIYQDYDLYPGYSPIVKHSINFYKEKDDTQTYATITDIGDGALVDQTKLPADPTKEGYNFGGWCTDKAGTKVFDFTTVKIYQDYDLYAGYTPIPVPDTYTVTWLNYDGTVLEEDTGVEEGATPSCSVTPSRESDIYHQYTFNKWLPEVSEVHSNQTYVASFNETHYDTQVYMKVNITEETKTIDIETKSGSTAPIVYWGDGENDTSKSHTYANVGEYKIRIVGIVLSVAMGSNGKDAIEELYLGPTINIIEEDAFYGCNNLKSVSFFEQSPVTEIKANAFTNCPIVSITIPSNIKTIGYSAFERCELNSIAFKNNSTLETIGDRAFAYPNFESVIIPKTVKTIGYGAFGTMTPAFESKLNSVAFENGSVLETIGDDAFYRSLIPSIFIPKTVKTIGNSAFSGCTKITNITIETGSVLENLGNSAFDSTAIQSIMIPKGVKSIGDSAFMDCSNLTSVTFETGTVVESIGEYAFSDTSIQSITIPKTVKTIVSVAFASCKKLLSVTFESGSVLESIDDMAFIDCEKLALVEMTTIATPPTLGERAFSYCSDNIEFHIKKGTKSLYTAADGWKDFSEGHFIEVE